MITCNFLNYIAQHRRDKLPAGCLARVRMTRQHTFDWGRCALCTVLAKQMMALAQSASARHLITKFMLMVAFGKKWWWNYCQREGKTHGKHFQQNMLHTMSAHTAPIQQQDTAMWCWCCCCCFSCDKPNVLLPLREQIDICSFIGFEKSGALIYADSNDNSMHDRSDVHVQCAHTIAFHVCPSYAIEKALKIT